MKAKRLLFLVMAICLTSGMKAQFYDSADDIYYYVAEYDYTAEIKQVHLPNGMPTLRWEKTGKIIKEIKEGSQNVLVFNFDGMKAAQLTDSRSGESVYDVKQNLQKSSSYYEDKVETTDYVWKYSSSSYKSKVEDTEFKWKSSYALSLGVMYESGSDLLIFSNDRETLVVDHGSSYRFITYYKRVDKSYFKVGRSRTPSSTMHE